MVEVNLQRVRSAMELKYLKFALNRLNFLYGHTSYKGCKSEYCRYAGGNSMVKAPTLILTALVMYLLSSEIFVTLNVY